MPKAENLHAVDTTSLSPEEPPMEVVCLYRNVGLAAHLLNAGAFLGLAQQKGDLPIAEPGSFNHVLLGRTSKPNRKFSQNERSNWPGIGHGLLTSMTQTEILRASSSDSVSSSRSFSSAASAGRLPQGGDWVRCSSISPNQNTR